MKKNLLWLMIVLQMAGIQFLSAQTENKQKSLANSGSENLRMQKTITDANIGSKKIFSERNFENVFNQKGFLIDSPEVNWQFTDPAAIVSDIKVSTQSENSFVSWELNNERISLYKDSSTPLWENPVIADWNIPIDMTEDGNVLVFSAQNVLKVYGPQSSVPTWELNLNANIKGVVLSPDGTKVYCAAENYEGTGFTHIFCYNIGINDPVWDVAFESFVGTFGGSGDGSTLVLTQYSGVFRSMFVISSSDGSVIFEAGGKNQNPPAISYDGSLIVNGDYNGYVKLYEFDDELNTYYEKWNFHVGGGGTSAWVIGMGISGDGSTVVVGTLVFIPGGYDGEIYCFDSYSPEPLWVYEHTGDEIESVDLSFDGSIIAAAGYGPLDHSRPDFFLFRKNSNQPIFTINTPGSMFDTDISPDGTMCTFGGKAVHAREFGSGGILYNINSYPGGGVVEGIVDLENSEDNSGARIEIPELNEYFGYSESDGSYSIEFIPDGTYSITASKVGYFPVTIDDVVVTEGEITSLDFDLLSTGYPPENLFVTNAAGSTVDLFWDPPQEKSYTGFNIYRKKYLEGLFPEEPLASVSAEIFEYSDTTALPTINYFYAVTAILEGDAQSPYSNIEEGWVSTGFVTNEISVYHGTTPVIDGIISEGEWDDAFLIDNSDFLGTYDNTIIPVGSVMGYFKSNDSNTELYVAYINYNDVVLADHDEVALYIDDNNDGTFPPPEDLSEGNYWAAHYASGDVIKYRPIFNTGGVGDVIYLDAPQIAVSNSAGYVVYEFVIPIGTEYWELNPSPEGKSSLAIFVLDDPSAFDGWWPYNNQNLFAPEGFGTMSLNAVNEIPPAPENLCASINESTAIIEWGMPEINDFSYFNIYSEFNREFSLLGNTEGTQFLYDFPEYGLYQFYVTTVDNSGLESDPSEIIEIEYGGTIGQDISLHEGFQFISSYIIAPDPDMMVVMADILNDNLVFARNSLGQTLRKIGPNWVNGIGNWIIDEGYLVKMNADDSFTIEGIRVNSSIGIPVPAGFKFVSYFPENAMDALLAFGSIIGDDLDFIRDSEGTMIRKIGPNWVNGIGDAMPGEGYLVKMFADGEIVYPVAAKSSGLLKVKPSHLFFEGGNAAEAVYTLYIKGLEIGDEVAAYNENVILGSMTVTSDNAYNNALPVFSELTNGTGYVAGEPISLKVWSDDKLIIADFEMESVYNSYVSDVYPSNDGEYSVVSITKGATLTGDLLVYPNPATNMIYISSPNQINNVVIFNYVGQSVYEGNSPQINTSNFETGIYIIRIETDNGIETFKVTIK